MNYVIIDTNVIVSALLAQNRHTSVPFAILEAVFLGKITPVVSQAIMDEYQNVLSRDKFGFGKSMVDTVLSELRDQAMMINPPITKTNILPHNQRKS